MQKLCGLHPASSSSFSSSDAFMSTPVSYTHLDVYKRQAHAALELTLVRGNHDGHAGDPPPDWGVRCLDGPLHLGPLALAHHPDWVAGRYVLAGHLHPGAVVSGRGPGHLRLPCFHFGPAVGVLPAFGDFTGLHVMPRGPDDRVVLVVEDSLRALNSAA